MTLVISGKIPMSLLLLRFCRTFPFITFSLFSHVVNQTESLFLLLLLITRSSKAGMYSAMSSLYFYSFDRSWPSFFCSFFFFHFVFFFPPTLQSILSSLFLPFLLLWIPLSSETQHLNIYFQTWIASVPLCSLVDFFI